MVFVVMLSGLSLGLLAVIPLHEFAHVSVARRVGAEAKIVWFPSPHALIEAPQGGLEVRKWRAIARAGYVASLIMFCLTAIVAIATKMPFAAGIAIAFLADVVVSAVPVAERSGRKSDGWMVQAFRRLGKYPGDDCRIQVNAQQGTYIWMINGWTSKLSRRKRKVKKSGVRKAQGTDPVWSR